MNTKDKIKLLVSSTKAHVKRLRAQGAIQHPGIPVNELFERTHASSPVFVLSTGRTGTQLLTSIFELSEETMAEHEPNPNLNFYSKLAWEQAKDNDFFEGVFEGARYESLRDAIILNKIYVETNNRITFLAKHILACYPNARFVHLVRKPESFVKSGLGRNWYENSNIHDEGRIVKNEGWQNLSQVERISWLWTETNSWIFDFGKTLRRKQFHTLRSEDLYAKPAKVKEMLAFCGIIDVSQHQISEAQSKKVNEGSSSAKKLSSDELAIINKVCLKLKSELYGE